MKARFTVIGERMRSLVVLGFAIFCLAAPVSALDKKEYKIFIVSDTLKDKFVELQNGFRETLDAQLSAAGAQAAYTVFDTKTSPDTVPGIIKAIKDGEPDLICVINSSGVFADTNITLKLTDPKYKFVSENCIPVQSGVAKEWKKPGGNITGVGVFIQFSSMIKLAQIINPKANKVIFYSWKAMKDLNSYFETEIRSACKETKVELAEIKYLSSSEDEMDYVSSFDKAGTSYLAICGVDVFVHRDGTPANMAVDGANFIQNKIKHIPIYGYDEVAIRGGYPAGTCVVWYDIGIQMGEKAMKILQGAKPGDITWDYPRKYNLMFNLASIKNIGLNVPQSLLTAAYRVYTDFSGNYLGNKN